MTGVQTCALPISFVLDVNMSVMEGGIGLFPRRMMVADAHNFRARAILKDNEIELSEDR